MSNKLVKYWCLHCEMVSYLKIKHDIIEDQCPICGAGYYDLWVWEDAEFRAVNGYPVTPLVGQHYPMYPNVGEVTSVGEVSVSRPRDTGGRRLRICSTGSQGTRLPRQDT